MTERSLKIIVDGKDDVISVDSFLSVVRNSYALLRHLQEEKGQWAVGEVSHNSPLSMELVGRGRTAPSDISNFVNGLSAIQSGRGKPSRFDDRALELAKSIAAPLQNGLAVVSFVSDETKPLRISVELSSKATVLIGPKYYYEYTELEGILELIKVHEGKGELGLYDRLTGNVTACKFESENPEQIGSLITHRITVFGKAKYNRNNVPVSIDVEDVSAVGDSVSIDALHRKGFRLNTDVSSEELIRRMRDLDA